MTFVRAGITASPHGRPADFLLVYHLETEGPVSRLSALRQTRTSARTTARSALPLILLQKSFWGEDQKFLEPLMRFTRGNVRDHIGSSKIDH
jgi:hypothetical protein